MNWNNLNEVIDWAARLAAANGKRHFVIYRHEESPGIALYSISNDGSKSVATGGIIMWQS